MNCTPAPIYLTIFTHVTSTNMYGQAWKKVLDQQDMARLVEIETAPAGVVGIEKALVI